MIVRAPNSRYYTEEFLAQGIVCEYHTELCNIVLWAGIEDRERESVCPIQLMWSERHVCLVQECAV